MPPSSSADQADPHADVVDILSELRAEIDALDGRMLEILDQRLALARRIGAGKPAAQPGGGSAFRPDREQAVVQRLLDRARPALRPVVLGIWREIMGAGLAAQGDLSVVVWSGAGGRIGLDAARRRFGASAAYASAYSATEALDAAQDSAAVAILALQQDTPWWAELAEARPDLWVCEALASRAGGEPEALAVARVPPATLARGAPLRISAAGGDADWTRAPMRTLAEDGALRLQAAAVEEQAEITAADRTRGVVGRIPKVL